MSAPAQDVLNRQLVDGCDFGVAVFWSRLGSPTAKHESGSVEEVERLLERQCRVMVYFCSRDIPQDRLSDDQFARLHEVRKRFEQRGLLATYASTEELAKLVTLHLTGLVNELLIKERAGGQPIPSTGTLTAPTPDIRVKTCAVLAARGPLSQAVVQISVENHSPTPFFFSWLKLVDEDLNVIFVPRDCLTGEHLMPRRIEPGDSFSLCFDPAEMFSQIGERRLLSAVATDKIGRTFTSASGTLVAAMDEWQRYAETLARMRP